MACYARARGSISRFEDVHAVGKIVLSVARDCWAGRKEVVTLSDFVTEIEASDGISANDRNLIRSFLQAQRR